MRLLTAGAVVAAAVAGSASTASAATAAGNSGNGKMTTMGSCAWEDWYSNFHDQGRVMNSFGPTYANYNGTGSTMPMDLTATVGGTATVSVSGSWGGSANILVADANVSMSLSLSVSLTASVTNSVHPTARPGTTVYGQFGVWREQTAETYSVWRTNCTEVDSAVTSWSPNFVGWNVWGG